MKRRDFLGRLVSTTVGASVAAGAGVLVDSRPALASTAEVGVGLADVIDPPAALTRTWLGPELWANRLQDFRVANGRYEMVSAGKTRTVALLTHDLREGDGTAQLSMVTGTLATGNGYSGFLVGVGGGGLDYRAAALAQAASGTGGGLLCAYENDGRCRFRSHTSETNQLSYPVLSTGTAGPARSATEQVLLTLVCSQDTASGRFTLTLSAQRLSDGATLSVATLTGLADSQVAGGVLVACGPVGSSSARYWFRTISTAGDKVTTFPERAMGPILGTLFSLNDPVLKMTAQLFPIATTEPQTVTLQYRQQGTPEWTTGPSATIGDGYTAILRVDDWDVTRDWDYQVVYASGTESEFAYAGSVAAAPADATDLVVAVVNCTIHSYRPLDGASTYTPKLANETPQGLYTTQNLYFPYAEVSANISAHGPHLLAALGDQFYENRPTAQDHAASPTMDFLGRYFLWVWAFRDLTASIPCVVLVDDHDVYQGNLWGHEGAQAPGDDRSGGYIKAAAWVNIVQRVQQGHDPDPFDPTPVKQGITVSYGAFTYRGVSVALVEDRKFKYGPNAVDPNGHPAPLSTLPMLGSRQEQFLAAWPSLHPGQPTLMLSQTTYATVKTTPAGGKQSDPDNDAYVQARNRALALVKAARAVMVCGDQHLGSTVRHGLATFTDGPVQFTVPAAGTAWQRWFEATNMPNSQGTPHTGDFTDGQGNRFRVLAVANPLVSQSQYLAAYGSSTHNFGDRSLKREGYGIVRIDKTAETYQLESWPWNVDPTADAAAPYPGWPVVVPFAQA